MTQGVGNGVWSFAPVMTMCLGADALPSLATTSFPRVIPGLWSIYTVWSSTCDDFATRSRRWTMWCSSLTLPFPRTFSSPSPLPLSLFFRPRHLEMSNLSASHERSMVQMRSDQRRVPSGLDSPDATRAFSSFPGTEQRQRRRCATLQVQRVGGRVPRPRHGIGRVSGVSA